MRKGQSVGHSVGSMLWAFDRELAGGKRPNWNGYLKQCRTASERVQLLGSMISAEIDLAGWDAKRIGRRLSGYATFVPSKLGCAGIIRGLYADQLKSGRFPCAEEMASLGLPLEVLRLRGANEEVFLGLVLGGRYRLEQVLGIGSFGVVYRGRDLAGNRTVAVKSVCGKAPSARAEARNLLAEEERALRTLPHPRIPRFIERAKVRGGGCLVMDYVDGGTLHELCQKGPICATRAARIVSAIADALDFAHRQGYVHRDLKLANVLLDKAERPYVGDFGLALPQTEQFDREGESGGSFGYMAAESLLGMTRQLDGRADIWSAGVILYELLTGKELTERDCREAAFVAAVVLERRRLRFPRDVPVRLRRICRKCLALDPNDRYHTAGLLRSDLQAFLGDRNHGEAQGTAAK